MLGESEREECHLRDIEPCTVEMPLCTCFEGFVHHKVGQVGYEWKAADITQKAVAMNKPMVALTYYQWPGGRQRG